MNTSMTGLVLLALLNIVLGILIAVICFRISRMNQFINDVESRISRLEVLTNLQYSSAAKNSKED